MRIPFVEIMETEKEVNHNWSNRDIARFHYFNKNGLHAKWKKMCDTLRQYVERGTIRSGWLVAYGSFADYQVRNLDDLVSKKRVNSTKLNVCLEMLQADIDKGYTKLGEHLLEGNANG